MNNEHGVPIRRRLLLLAAAVITPIALFAGAGLYALFEQQREQGARAVLEVARARATAPR